VPREERIFEAVVDPPTRMRTRQGASVLLTVLLETALIAVLVMVPLMATDVLPAPTDAINAFVAAPAPPPTPPPPPAPRTQPIEPAPQPVVNVRPDVAPIEAPPDIVPEPPIAFGIEEIGSPAVPGDGVSGGFGLPGGQGDLLRPPPPRPEPPPPQPRVVGGHVLAPKKTRHVDPIYPAIAIASRTEAIVIIEAIIDERGRVSEAQVLRGNPLLNDAALDAVRQWEFTPTLLNGQPTAVIMSVTVNFRLQ
jgi:periplasmic protein TonB